MTIATPEDINILLEKTKNGNATRELAMLAKKVRENKATHKETIKYMNIVEGLLEEYTDLIKSLPKDTEVLE